MSDDDQPVPLRPDKNQRTLFSLAKVVRLESTSMCFTLEEICGMKQELLVPSQTKYQVCCFFNQTAQITFHSPTYISPPSLQLLNILRKLDCYKLRVEDLQRSDIGSAVATLAVHHPKPDVAKLAASLLQKWRELVENSLFQRLQYDIETARASEDGEAFAPEDLIAAEKEQQRLEKLERRRQRIEEDFMAVSSSEDERDSSESEDPEWAPQIKKSAPRDSLSFRRSRSGKMRAVERAAAAAEAQAAAPGVSPEAEIIETLEDARENAGDGNVVVMVTTPADGNQSQARECSMADALPASVPSEPSQADSISAPAKKQAKKRPTILALLQRQAAAHAEAQAQAQAAATT